MPAGPEFGKVACQIGQIVVGTELDAKPQADAADDAGIAGKIVVQGKRISQQIELRYML